MEIPDFKLIDDGSIAAAHRAYVTFADRSESRLRELAPEYLEMAFDDSVTDYNKPGADPAKDAIRGFTGHLKIPKRPGLSQEQRIVEAEMAYLVQNRTEMMAAYARFHSLTRYRAHNIVSCDDSLFIHPLMHHHLTRPWIHEAGCLSANVIRDLNFHLALVEKGAAETPRFTQKHPEHVALVAGGSGSGKSAFVQSLKESEAVKYHAIYEHVFYRRDEVEQLVEKANKNKLHVDYFLVYRDPISSGQSLWNRIENGGLSIRVAKVIDGHAFAAETCKLLFEKALKGVTVNVVDNRAVDSPHRVVGLEEFRNMLAYDPPGTREQRNQMKEELITAFGTWLKGKPFTTTSPAIDKVGDWPPQLFSPRAGQSPIAFGAIAAPLLPMKLETGPLLAVHAEQIFFPEDHGMSRTDFRKEHGIHVPVDALRVRLPRAEQPVGDQLDRGREHDRGKTS